MEYYYGHIIAIGELVDSVKMTEDRIASEPEYSFGWYAVCRTGLIIANVKRIEPVPAKGKWGFGSGILFIEWFPTILIKPFMELVPYIPTN